MFNRMVTLGDYQVLRVWTKGTFHIGGKGANWTNLKSYPQVKLSRCKSYEPVILLL